MAKEITDKQKKTLQKHSKHHTKKHIIYMTKLMKQGKTFTESHNLAQRKVGS
jgi:hypothetical protein